MELDHEKLKSLINQASRKIIQNIIIDLSDRKGLRQEWDQIDDSVQKEIRAEWRSLVQRVLAEFGRDLLKEIIDPIQGAIEKELAGEGKGEEIASLSGQISAIKCSGCGHSIKHICRGKDEAPGVGGPPDAGGV